jgi:hypothetical protein
MLLPLVAMKCHSVERRTQFLFSLAAPVESLATIANYLRTFRTPGRKLTMTNI